MKILPYAIALIFSSVISVLLTYPASFIIHWLNAKIYEEPPAFWTGLWLGAIESLVLVLFSYWVFIWFRFILPLFFIICIAVMILFNNIKRYNTRPNKRKELGFLIGETVGIPAIYYQFINEFSDGSFIFW